VLRSINVSKRIPSNTPQFITKATNFGRFLEPSSDLYTRTHERNYTIYKPWIKIYLLLCWRIKLRKNAYESWKQCEIKIRINMRKAIY